MFLSQVFDFVSNEELVQIITAITALIGAVIATLRYCKPNPGTTKPEIEERQAELKDNLSQRAELIPFDIASTNQQTIWKVYQVAFLWHDYDPPNTLQHFSMMTAQIENTKSQLHNAIDQGLLKVNSERKVVNGFTRFVSRDALIEYCKTIGERPKFLFPNST